MVRHRLSREVRFISRRSVRPLRPAAHRSHSQRSARPSCQASRRRTRCQRCVRKVRGAGLLRAQSSSEEKPLMARIADLSHGSRGVMRMEVFRSLLVAYCSLIGSGIPGVLLPHRQLGETFPFGHNFRDFAGRCGAEKPPGLDRGRAILPHSRRDDRQRIRHLGVLVDRIRLVYIPEFKNRIHSRPHNGSTMRMLSRKPCGSPKTVK